MTRISKLVVTFSMAAALALGACSSESECADGECTTVERGPSGDRSNDNGPFVPCEEVCSNLDECGFMAEDDCMTVCGEDVFSADERACLAVACGDAIARCFDAVPPPHPPEEI